MRYGIYFLALTFSSASLAADWSGAFDCISNDAKKEKMVVSFLDSEIVRTRESPTSPERYYRVTDSSDELVEGAILGHKSGATGRVVAVAKGTMNFTMTKLDSASITAAVKVGKSARTYSCTVSK